MAFETQLVTGTGVTAAPTAGADAARDRRGRLALMFVAVCVASMQLMQGLNADTSWLVTVAEHWLSGQRPYVDILELNPPFSVISVMPAVIAGDWLGIRPDFIVIAGTSLLALIAIEVTIALGATAPGQVASAEESPAAQRLVWGFALLILPVSIFTEREHLAVIALLPMWRAMQLRAHGRPVPVLLVIAAGFGGGIAMAFKPQFAAMILLPALGLAILRRSPRDLIRPEYWIAGALVTAYGLGVLLLLPGYFQTMVPLVLAYYRPVTEPLMLVVTGQVMPAVVLCLIGLVLIARDRLADPALLLPLLAALGGFLGVIEQQKGFGYHYYPLVAALVPALLGRAIVLANGRFRPGVPGAERAPAIAGFLAIAVGLAFAALGFYGPTRPLNALVVPIRARFEHPRMMSISAHFWVGHPLTRDAGGTWVGSVPNQWMTLGALYKLGLGRTDAAGAHKLAAVIEADKTRAADEIARRKPNIVIVEHDDRVFPAWFRNEAELAGFLPGYTRIGTAYDVIDVWSRKP